MILQKNVNGVKVENYDLQSEGDLIDMKTDGLDIPSAFSVNKIKLEVSLVFVFLQFLFLVVSVFVYSTSHYLYDILFRECHQLLNHSCTGPHCILI
jgi:hypothetical protein